MPRIPKPYTRAMSPREELIYRCARRICERVYSGIGTHGSINRLANRCTCPDGKVCDNMRDAAEDVINEIMGN